MRILKTRAVIPICGNSERPIANYFYGFWRSGTWNLRFQNVVQEVPVTAGSNTRLRVQHRAENIRVEFKQRRSDFRVQLTYLNNGVSVSPPAVKNGRLGSHVWEMLEIESQVPYNATEARI